MIKCTLQAIKECENLANGCACSWPLMYMEVAGHLHALAVLIPVICPSLSIEYEDGMGPRGGLGVPQKRDIACLGLISDYVYSVVGAIV